MRVAICVIGKCENRYIREFILYHTKMVGVDKIFLYDNNDIDGEHFEDVISDLIDDELVEITDYRGRKICQLQAYNECYEKYGAQYDWIAFIDCDEFISFNAKSTYRSIKDFLGNDKFDGFDAVYLNWLIFDDNGNVRYEPKPVIERFAQPMLPINKCITYSFPENYHVKTFARGGKEIRFSQTPHVPSNGIRACNAVGQEVDSMSPFQPFVYSTAFLRHYTTKTIEEFLDIKVKRGFADTPDEIAREHLTIDKFFKCNEKTEDKLKFAEQFMNGADVDIFVCTHKDFKIPVNNSAYKIIDARKINGDVAENGLDGSFYSEFMVYKYVAENLKLKKYVGFCHYRKYFSFLDDIPNMDDIFKNFDCVSATVLKFDTNCMEQYGSCHNVKDLEIVGGIIAEKYPEYKTGFDLFTNGNLMIPCNMFIMRSEDFRDYIKFVFDVLDDYLDVVGLDIWKRIDDNKEEYLHGSEMNRRKEYQYRIGGYLGERLTNVFIMAKFKKIKMYDIVYTENESSYKP